MQIKLNVDFQVAIGSIKNDVTRVGEMNYPKLVTKSGIGGVGYMQIVTSPPKKNMFKFKKHLVLLMNSRIFLAFKYTLSPRLGTCFIDL